MKHDHCVVCGTKNDLQQHHIDPVVYGRSSRTKKKNKNYDPNKSLKDCSVEEIFRYLHDLGHISDDEEITTCSYHHNIFHGIVKFQKAEHGKLIKEGMKKAIAEGKKIGRPSDMTKNEYIKIVELFIQGKSFKKIAKSFNCGVGTVYKVLEDSTGYKSGCDRKSFYPKAREVVVLLKEK